LLRNVLDRWNFFVSVTEFWFFYLINSSYISRWHNIIYCVTLLLLTLIFACDVLVKNDKFSSRLFSLESLMSLESNGKLFRKGFKARTKLCNFYTSSNQFCGCFRKYHIHFLILNAFIEWEFFLIQLLAMTISQKGNTMMKTTLLEHGNFYPFTVFSFMVWWPYLPLNLKLKKLLVKYYTSFSNI
jgi:hypothetical protein